MKRFFALTVLFGIGQYVVYQCLEGLIFLLAHFPPRVVSFDRIIVVLNGVETILIAPKIFLRWLWPGEFTPAGLNLFLLIANGLVWGATLAGWRAWKTSRHSGEK